MPPAKNAKSGKARVKVIQAITTPLPFYVLALMIAEGTLCIVLTASKLNEEKVWLGFLWMIGVFMGVVVVVTLFAWFNPRHLLYGTEERSNPELEKSALRDQIEDLIYANVKEECLQMTEKRGN